MEKCTFDDFNEYRNAQVETHLRKIHLTWFCGMTALPFRLAAEKLLADSSLSVICMGSRNGLEPRFFHEYGFARSLGTDIAPTANVLPYMMMHDFHEMRPSYVAPFDVLYSNSFDHAIDIDKFLLAGRSFLRDKSVIILDYSPSDNSTIEHSKSADCLAIGMDELISRVYSVTGNSHALG